MMRIFTFIQNGAPVQQANGNWSMTYLDILAANRSLGLTILQANWEAIDVGYLGYFTLAPTAAPAFDSATQNAPTEALPIELGGVWTQQWNAPTALTSEQLAALVPQSITHGQAAVTLLRAGVWAPLQTYIATLPEEDQIVFATYAVWDRQSPMLLAVAAGMGWTAAQLDRWFTTGAKVEL